MTEILHIKKNIVDRHENVFLLLIPLVVFAVTLATLLSILNSPHFSSKGKTVAGENTQALDER